MTASATLTPVLTVSEAATQRRSIRAYDPAPIPHADLDEILRIASLAPSAFNAQPWRFVVVESPEVKEKLAGAAYNQRQVHSAPAVIVLYTDMADTLARVDEIMHPGMPADQREGAKAAFIGSWTGKSEAEQEAWAYGQGHIALGYLLLAAESLGYQTSPMGGFDPEAVKQLLGLPANVRVPALVAIGHGREEGFSHHRYRTERISRFV